MCGRFDPLTNSIYQQISTILAKWILYFFHNYFQARQYVKHERDEWNHQHMQAENLADWQCKAIVENVAERDLRIVINHSNLIN